MRIVYIYALLDPVAGEVFYVGKTNNLKNRLLWGYEGKVQETLQKILNAGSRVIQIVLEIIQCQGEITKLDWIPEKSSG